MYLTIKCDDFQIRERVKRKKKIATAIPDGWSQLYERLLLQFSVVIIVPTDKDGCGCYNG